MKFPGLSPRKIQSETVPNPDVHIPSGRKSKRARARKVRALLYSVPVVLLAVLLWTFLKPDDSHNNNASRVVTSLAHDCKTKISKHSSSTTCENFKLPKEELHATKVSFNFSKKAQQRIRALQSQRVATVDANGVSRSNSIQLAADQEMLDVFIHNARGEWEKIGSITADQIAHPEKIDLKLLPQLVNGQEDISVKFVSQETGLDVENVGLSYYLQATLEASVLGDGGSAAADEKSDGVEFSVKTTGALFPAESGADITSHVKAVDKADDPALGMKITDTEGNKIALPPSMEFSKVVKDTGADDWKVSIKPNKQMKVGRYKAHFKLSDGQGNVQSVDQDFLWGVLAMNYDKSSYVPGDRMNLEFAVLNEQGKTVCDADLKLEIDGPESSTLSTKTGEIGATKDCERYSRNDLPDYRATWTIPNGNHSLGTYHMVLTATTANGTYQIGDVLNVDQDPGVRVIRKGPTRIYPPAIYPVDLEVTATKNFRGTITETVPANFKISNQTRVVDRDSNQIVGEPISTNGPSTASANSHETKQLRWRANFSAGRHYKLSYEFNGPNISPEFWLLGPLKMNDLRSHLVYQEPRSWEIASDAVTKWLTHATDTVDSVPALTNNANMAETAQHGGSITTTQATFGTTTGNYLFKPTATNAATGTPGASPAGFGFWNTQPYLGSSASANWTFRVNKTDTSAAATCNLRVIAYTNTSRSTSGATQLFDTGALGTDLCTNSTATVSQTYNPGAINLTTRAPSGTAKYILFEYWINVSVAGSAGQNIKLNIDGTSDTSVLPEATNTFSAGTNISGTLYTGEGSGSPGVAVTMKASKNGGTPTSVTSSTAGVYTVGVDAPSSGDILTIFNGSNATYKANTITTYSAANTAADGKNMTGIDLYVNHVITRGSLSNASTSIGRYDNDDDSTYMLFTSNSNTYVGEAGIELFVWTGATFTPGGDVTVNTAQLELQGTYSGGGGNTFTTTGSGTGTSRPIYVNGGTYGAHGTTKFQGTSASEIESQVYGNLEFSPASGSPTYTLLSGTLTTYFTAMTVGDGTHAVTVTAATNNPDINVFTTLTVKGSGTFTSGSGTYGIGKIDIQSSGSYSAGGSTTNISGSGTGSSRPLIANGTFNSSSSTIIFKGTGNTEIEAATYVSLKIQPTSGSPTYFLGTASGQSLGVLLLTVGDGSNAVTVDANTYDPDLAFVQITLNASSTWTKSNSATMSFTALFGQSVWTDNTAAGQDLGKVRMITTLTLNLATPVTVESLTIDPGVTITSSGNKQLTISGSGTPFASTGSFTTSGPIKYTGTGTVTFRANTYAQGLEFAPSGGAATAITPAGNITVGNSTNGGTLYVRTGASITWGSTSLTMYGDLQIDSGSTWTKSSAGVTWTPSSAPVGTSVWTDSTSGQDIGDVSITGGTGLKVVALGTNSNSKATSITIASGSGFKGGLSGGTIVLTGSGTPLVANGSFVPGLTTVTYAGTGSVNVAGTQNGGNISYSWNLELAPAGGVATDFVLGTASSQSISIGGTNPIVPGSLVLKSGAHVDWDTYDPALTLMGYLTLNSPTTWTKSSSQTLAWKPTSSETWTDNNATPQDIGDISIASGALTPKITIGSSVKATSITIDAGHELDLGSSGYTLTLTGSGTPLVAPGVFTAGYSTVVYAGTGATTVASVSDTATGGTGISYNSLSLTPASGTPTYTIGGNSGQSIYLARSSGHNGNLTLGTGVTANWDTYDDIFVITGNISFASGSTWIKSASQTLQWQPTGTSTWTDNNTTKQDVGVISISGGSSTPTVLLSTEVKATKVTVGTGQIFSLGVQAITVSGSGTGTSRPLYVNGGTFSGGLGTVYFAGTAATQIEATTYGFLVMHPASGTPTYTLGTASSQTVTAGYLWAGQGVNVDWDTYDPAINLSRNLSLESPSTWTKSGTATMTFSPAGGTNLLGLNSIKDANATKQDIGKVAISGGSSSPKISLDSSVKLTSVSIASSHEFDLGTSGYTLTVTGSGQTSSRPINNSGTVTVGDATVDYAGSGTTDLEALTYSTLKLSGGSTYNLSANTSLTNLNIASGTLDAVSGQNYSLTVAGNWTNAGAFQPRSGLVTFNTGATATISGATTFYDLTITHTAAKEVDFSTTGSHIIDVSHTFTVTGHAANLIKLYSTSSGSKWHFHPTGTANVDYADVRDGGCESGAIYIDPTHSTDSGNNEPCWFNTAPNDPTDLEQYKSDGTTLISAGGWTTTNTVIYKAITSDFNVLDTNQICAETKTVSTAFTDSQDGCGTLVLQGSQATFTTGALSDGRYHWQIQSKDDTGDVSSWKQCNSTTGPSAGVCGANGDTPTAGIDFGVDVTQPVTGTVYDGTSVGVDAAFNTGSLSTLSANWSGFSDATSGLDTYSYSIGTSPGATDVVDWTTNGSSTSVTENGLTLQTSQPYYFNIRVTDVAGNTSSVVSSNGQVVAPTLTLGVSPSSVAFDNLNPGNSFAPPVEDVTLTVSTNAYNGYAVYVRATDDLTLNGGTETIDMFNGGTPAAPGVWGSSLGFGFTSNDCKIGATAADKWGTGGSCTTGTPTKYSPFSTSPFDTSVEDQIAVDHNPVGEGQVQGSPLSDTWQLGYKVVGNSLTKAGDYSTTIVFLALPTY